MNTMDSRLYDEATLRRIDGIKKHKKHDDLIKERTDLMEEIKGGNPNLLLGVSPILENTVLHLAAKVGNKDLVKEVCDECELLMVMTLLAMRNSKGDTALHIAARAGHLSIVNILVEKSTFIDVEGGGKQANNILRVQNKGNNTVLHEALRYHHQDVAEVLTDKSPELWLMVNEAGESPLYLAAKGGLSEIAGKVLKSSQPYAHEGPNKSTALHGAVIWGKEPYDIRELLMEKKRELIKEQDIYGRTALHYAASYDDSSTVVVESLLEEDNTVAYIQDKDGRSPLHYAASKGHIRITRAIIRWYPDAVELVDKKGQSAFHVCIANYNQYENPGRYEMMLDSFISKHVNDELINQADNDGNTPFHLAVNRSSSRLLRFLLKKYEGRVDIDAVNKANMTPLDLALDLALQRLIHPQAQAQAQAIEEEVNQVYKLLMKADAKRGIGKGFEEVTNPNRMVDEYNTRTKGMNKTQMVVATLIATVTFAAAFQVPGGYDKDGTATLAKEAAFQVFVVTDAIALSCSVTAVFLSFILPLLRDRWPLKLIKFVAILTLIAVVAMLVAFAAGLYVVLTDSLWLGISTCSIVFGLSSILVLFCKIFLNSDRRSDAKALNNSKSDDPKSDAS